MNMPMPQMLVCDLDGTLLMHGGTFSPQDLATLDRLGSSGVIRVIATGRALATARKVITADFPIDYLIFSSGAGILDWRSQSLLVSHTMDAGAVQLAVRTLLAHELDFMIHAPIPDQHIFQFHRTGNPNPDFERRLNRYAADGRLLDHNETFAAASQLLAVSPSADPDEPFDQIRTALSGLSVIRATSPLDGRSIWIEAFAPAVSKSQAADWIANRHGISPDDTLAIGNDYNDWDLLRWSGRAAVVHGAPAAMCEEFDCVRSLSEWLDEKEQHAREGCKPGDEEANR